ncbi:MAG: hypothetical protein LBH47_02455 [Christensenellaceae bacterium]|jgi:hypothetical protein|nr:hypothetical protein [Christensenellaceae bacterium]
MHKLFSLAVIIFAGIFLSLFPSIDYPNDKIIFSLFEDEGEEEEEDPEPAKTPVSVPHYSVIYDGTSKDFPIDPSDLWTAAGELSGINAGVYEVTLTLKDEDNYCWEDEEFNGQVKWRINKAQERSFTLVDFVKWVYDPSGSYPDISLTEPLLENDAVSFEYSVNKSLYPATNVRPSGVGNYYVRAMVANPNYEASYTPIIFFYIEKARQTVTEPVVETIEENKIILRTVVGAEYSRINGVWQDEPIFNDLDADTDYVFLIRLKETANYFESQIAFAVIRTQGHIWGEWIVDREATLESEGEEHRVCINYEEEVAYWTVENGFDEETIAKNIGIEVRTIPKIVPEPPPPQDLSVLLVTVPILTFAVGVCVAIVVQLINEKKQNEE